MGSDNFVSVPSLAVNLIYDAYTDILEVVSLEDKNIRYYVIVCGDTQPEGLRFGWYEGQGWYFWDETQSQAYGPYLTFERAKAAMANWPVEGET